MRSPRLVVFLALALAANLASQQFQPAVEKGLYPHLQSASGPAGFADFDGDDRADLLVARLHRSGTSARPGILLNRPDGPVQFEVAPFPSDDEPALSFAFGDIDGDGDTDIAWIDGEPRARIHRNDGHGAFVESPVTLPVVDGLAEIELADFDGDGDLDLLLGTDWFFGPQPDLLLLNDGSGTFQDVTATHLNVTGTVVAEFAIGDIDGDQDLDVFVASSSAGATPSKVYENDGTGVFTDVTATTGLPALANLTSAAFVDLDADGDDDLLADQGGSVFLPGVQFAFVNDGTGSFTDESATRLLESAPDLAGATHTFIDVDGDGDDDLLGTGLRINDGTGVFTAVASPFTDAVASDVDADGDVDVWSENRVWQNDGTGSFVDRTAPPPNPIRVMPGSIALVPSSVPLSDATARVVGLRAIDLDHDGDLDLVDQERNIAADEFRLRVFTNDGTDTLLPTLVGPAFPYPLSDLAFGDVDGDGDTDVVIAFMIDPIAVSAGLLEATANQTRLYLNDGSGDLSDATGQLPVDAIPSADVALCDIDGDDDLDLTLGNAFVSFAGWPQQNGVWVNDGAGTFQDVTAASLPQRTDWTSAIALGDVDGDGDPDLLAGGTTLVIGGVQTVLDEPTRLLLNDGSGQFTDAGALPGRGEDVLFLDVDLDGDADALWGDEVELRFARATPGGLVEESLDSIGIPPGTLATGLVAADVDQDGDVDLLDGLTRLMVNRHRHLDAVRFARIGEEYVLRAHASPGYAPGIPLALPLVAFAPNSLPTPFGLLGLDPGSTTALPSIALPLFGGSSDLVLAIPGNAALADVEVFVQALIVQLSANPLAPRLTNTIHDRITTH